MQLHLWLAIGGGLGVVAALCSGWLRHLPLSAPLVGLLVGVAAGPVGVGVLDAPGGLPVLHDVTEILVAISLFAVALRFPTRIVLANSRRVAILVTVGMVATAALGALAAGVVLGVPAATAWLVGACIAPTDPVLSSNIVTGEPAERDVHEEVRVTLSTESGANDGLAWPLVILGIVLVPGDPLGDWWLEGVLGAVGAVVIGVVLGRAVGAATRRLDEQREIESSARFVVTLALALTVLGIADLTGADGLLAVFAAGLAYNGVLPEEIVDDELDVEEGTNQLAILPVFVLLGVLLPWDRWSERPLAVAGFAVVVLVARRLPVVLALRRPLRLDILDATFLGWYGPVGAAAVYYATLAHDRGVGELLVVDATLAVVAMSTVVHGLTATPGRTLYAALRQRTGTGARRAGTAPPD